MQKNNIISIFIGAYSIFFSIEMVGQDVGIGTAAPDYRLHIIASDSAILKLENSTAHDINVRANMFFKTGNRYTGAIKTIGTSVVDARLGLFTYASAVSSSLKERISILDDGKVGISTTTPDFMLHVRDPNPGSLLLKLENSAALANGISVEQFFKTGTFYTGAIKTTGTGSNSARLGLFTFSTATASSLVERMSIINNGFVGIGTTIPAYLLDVNGRMRIKYNGNTAGLWLANATNTNDVALVGMYNDDYVGFYGDLGGGWNLVMNTTTGRVGIGTLTPTDPINVVGNLTAAAGRFVNNYVNAANGVIGIATVTTNGTGVYGEGSLIGVKGFSDKTGSGDRYGLYGWGVADIGTSYGAYCQATGTGTVSYGIYAKGINSPINYGGYFVGDVYTTGAYLPSDRKLKNEIQPIGNALALIDQLKPSHYTYKTEDYEQMHLPEGIQYGLIADEVMQVFPDAVKKTIQPAEYENHDEQNGRKLSEEVEFEAINYTQLIPILIGAIQEQQKQIDELKKLVNELIVSRQP